MCNECLNVQCVKAWLHGSACSSVHAVTSSYQSRSRCGVQHVNSCREVAYKTQEMTQSLKITSLSSYLTYLLIWLCNISAPPTASVDQSVLSTVGLHCVCTCFSSLLPLWGLHSISYYPQFFVFYGLDFVNYELMLTGSIMFNVSFFNLEAIGTFQRGIWGLFSGISCLRQEN